MQAAISGAKYFRPVTRTYSSEINIKSACFNNNQIGIGKKRITITDFLKSNRAFTGKETYEIGSNTIVRYKNSYFSKDVNPLIKRITQNNDLMSLSTATEQNNKPKKNTLYRKVRDHFGGQENLIGRKITLWGLSLKSDTDDLRETLTVTIIKQLLEAGCSISVFDPAVKAQAKTLFGDTIKYSPDKYTALINTDCLIVLT